MSLKTDPSTMTAIASLRNRIRSHRGHFTKDRKHLEDVAVSMDVKWLLYACRHESDLFIKLLELPIPTLQDVINVGTAFESARHLQAKATTTLNPVLIFGVKDYQKNWQLAAIVRAVVTLTIHVTNVPLKITLVIVVVNWDILLVSAMLVKGKHKSVVDPHIETNQRAIFAVN